MGTMAMRQQTRKPSWEHPSRRRRQRPPWNGYGEDGTANHYLWECRLVPPLARQWRQSSTALKTEVDEGRVEKREIWRLGAAKGPGEGLLALLRDLDAQWRML